MWCALTIDNFTFCPITVISDDCFKVFSISSRLSLNIIIAGLNLIITFKFPLANLPADCTTLLTASDTSHRTRNVSRFIFARCREKIKRRSEFRLYFGGKNRSVLLDMERADRSSRGGGRRAPHQRKTCFLPPPSAFKATATDAAEQPTGRNGPDGCALLRPSLRKSFYPDSYP